MYATNNEQIARALGLPLTPRKRKATLVEIGRWLARPDFPKKHKTGNPPRTRGWIVTELQAWYRRFLDQSLAAPPAPPGPAAPPDSLLPTPEQQLTARLDFNQEVYFNPGKFPFKLAKWEVDELRDHGRIPKSEKAEAPDPAAAPPADLPSPIYNPKSQVDLTVMLAKFFAGHFSGDVVPQLISDWKLGKRLPRLPDGREAPLPPAREGTVWPGWKWVCWIRDYALADPRFCRRAPDRQGEMDLAEQAVHARHELDILNKKIKQIEFETAQREHDAQWVRAEDAERTLAEVVVSLRTLVRRENEFGDPAALREQCQTMNLSPEQTTALCAWMTARAVARLTAIEMAAAAVGTDANAPDERPANTPKL